MNLEQFGIKHLSVGVPSDRQQTTTSSGSTLIGNIRIDLACGVHLAGIRAFRREKGGKIEHYLLVPKTEPKGESDWTMDYVAFSHELQQAILAEILKREKKGELWDTARFDREADVDSNPIPFIKQNLDETGFKAYTREELLGFYAAHKAAAAAGR